MRKDAINVVTLRERMQSFRHHPVALLQFLLVHLGAILTGGVVLLLVGYILITGIPNLKPELFAWKFTTENQSMMPALINTLCMTVLTLLMAVPVGVCAAIYLAEYAKRGNKLVKLVRLTAETLSGIPSIVYGLFGLMFFNVAMGWGYSMLAGCVTLAIMILPLILRTTEEALLSVPDSYREGSFGLGAGKLRTVFRIILPSAMPGILSGIILAIGRIVGESAALIFTSGSGKENLTFVGKNGFSLFAPLFQSTRTLSVHMYNLMSEGLYTKQAQATAVVLLVLVVGINALSSFLAKKLTKGNENG
ncbi:MAG: phosphate ABC transporter permease PstA [Clostridiales bacterium]|nr:phosphate ABC transporter permease PstA [Clostridiales bacterium]